MTTQCPHCGSSFTVDDSLAGRQVRCTKCQNLFTIATPTPTPVPETASPLTPVPGPYDRLYRARGGRRGVASLVFMLIGAIALAGAFGTPWWKQTQTPYPDYGEDGPTREDLAEIDDQQREVHYEDDDTADWIYKHKVDVKLAKAKRKFDRKYGRESERSRSRSRTTRTREDDARTGKSYTVYLWGWNATVGVLSLVFGCVILLWAILALAIGVIQRWSWTGSFACLGLAVPIVILSLVWIFTTPHLDVIFKMSRGAFIGPFMAGGGALLVFIAALTDAIGGVVRLATGRRY